MKQISTQDLCGSCIHFEITDIFPEGWTQHREFSMYKIKPRPTSAFFFVCTEIEVTFFSMSDKSAICARKGDVVFIPRGMLYYVRVSGGSPMKPDTYTVNLHLLDDAGNECTLSEQITILTNHRDTLMRTHLKNLCDAFHSANEAPHQNARNCSKVKGEFYLLLDLIGSSGKQNDECYYPIRRGVELFCDEWNKNEKIEKYAQISDVSVTYFYRCFRKWAGKSPAEYRNVLRLSNAESLLRCTDMQICEIATAVGFEDPFYFCRIFSEHYGTSPKYYRKQFRETDE